MLSTVNHGEGRAGRQGFSVWRGSKCSGNTLPVELARRLATLGYEEIYKMAQDHRSPLSVQRIRSLPERFDLLRSDAAAEGFNNMENLWLQWRDGSNRFERPGEILAVATIDGEIAGIGGITQDFVDPAWLRMRRFYVRPAFRRHGAGRGIATYVLGTARPLGRQIALHAAGAEAKAFWPTLGFVEIDRENTTHILPSE